MMLEEAQKIATTYLLRRDEWIVALRLAYRHDRRSRDIVLKVLEHALDLCKRLQDLNLAETDKANRWLGFVQGVLVAYDLCTLQEVTRDNQRL